jgi:hypothetical protein
MKDIETDRTQHTWRGYEACRILIVKREKKKLSDRHRCMRENTVVIDQA